MSHRQGRRVNRERDLQEYERMDNPRSPAPSTAGTEGAFRPLDEIALLKRGFITKEGERQMLKHVEKKVSRPVEAPKPITLQELTERGLKFENGQIVYSLPQKKTATPKKMTSKVPEFSRTESSRSKRSKSSQSFLEYMDKMEKLSICPSNETVPAIRGMSHESLIETPMCTTTYRVGLPEERATLKLGDTNDGKRYDLYTPGFQLMMQISPRNTVILLYKD